MTLDNGVGDLHRLRTKRDADGLMSFLDGVGDDVSADLLVAALGSLAVLGERKASRSIAAYLRHDDARARAAAAGALREISDPETIPTLIHALKDPAPNVVGAQLMGWAECALLRRVMRFPPLQPRGLAS
jgi:HEAT repeat protein